MRKIKTILITLMFSIMIPTNVRADEMSVSECVEQQEHIIIPQEINSRMGIPQTIISGGKTVSFLDSNGTMFYVSSGTTVTFRVNISKSASVQMGYINSTDSKTKTYSGMGTSHATTFTIAKTGYYRFYVTNLSSGSITVTGGTITF